MSPTRLGSWYAGRAKRVFDLVGGTVALAILLPVLAATAIMVAIFLGRPILFAQQRPGRGGRPFMMRKFRTMTDACGPDGELLPDEVRLTRFGKLLRASSLDELPELLNVLAGDMSLVGPRPLLMEYLPLYNAEQQRRHAVRPGMTGWAQVNGRNSLGWADRLALDVWYVDHVSLALDLRIILKTVGKVVSRDGVTEPGEATMTKFRGSPDQ